ncbi:MAG: TIGR04372 family glycosyltransferase [Rhodospirillales bacterium]
MRSILQKFYHITARAFLAVIVLPVLWLVDPFWRFRLGLLHYQRIGHLAANTDAFLRRQQLDGKPKRTTYIFVAHDPANRQLFEMYRRHLNIIESRVLSSLFFIWQPMMKETRFWERMPWGSIDIRRFHLMNHTTKTLAFTPEEEARGKAALADMGIGENDWFVCFHARDGAYFRQWRPQYEDHWASRDFKNCHIENYIKAAEYIAEQGGYAIRMGAFTDMPLPENLHPRVIDYATKHRSDFMDIYLGASCRFFLASSSGINMIPMIFDKPIALANNYLSTMGIYHSYDLVSLRRIRERATGNVVSFRKAIDEGFFSASIGSSQSGKMEVFEFIENTPDEILDLTIDMMDQLDGKAPDPEAAALQKRYADEYLSHHEDYTFASRISPRFVTRHRDLLFPDDVPSELASSA